MNHSGDKENSSNKMTDRSPNINDCITYKWHYLKYRYCKNGFLKYCPPRHYMQEPTIQAKWHRLKVKEWKNRYHTNHNEENVGVTILLLSPKESKLPEEDCILITELILQENIF